MSGEKYFLVERLCLLFFRNEEEMYKLLISNYEEKEKVTHNSQKNFLCVGLIYCLSDITKYYLNFEPKYNDFYQTSSKRKNTLSFIH